MKNHENLEATIECVTNNEGKVSEQGCMPKCEPFDEDCLPC
jgi:hypothetical protein